MFKTFEVTASLKFPRIKQARKQAHYEGHTRQDGPLSYSAVEVG